jgi:hypothetical protein
VHRRVRNILLHRRDLGPVEDPRGKASRAVKKLRPLAMRRCRADRLEELPDDAVGEVAFQGQPACGEDPPARLLTRAQAARSSVVFPIPAGPSTSTTVPRPAAASAAAADSAASSASRSSIGRPPRISAPSSWNRTMCDKRTSVP